METIDLGLPSGLLWAKCNVGAEKETCCGDEFMWGSVEPCEDISFYYKLRACEQAEMYAEFYDKYCWRKAPFNNGNKEFDGEYFNSVKGMVCPNGNLVPEYDAACQILGEGWRLPTEEDFEELLSETTDKWVVNYMGTRCDGRLFISNINGNSIFIPFPYQLSDITHLWTSSLWKEKNDSAAAFYIRPHYDGINFCERYYRCNIRAVKEKNK